MSELYSSGIEFDNYPTRRDNFVSAFRKSVYFDDWAIPYDYNKARDLMRGAGYQARDTNEILNAIPLGETITIQVPAESLSYTQIYVVNVIGIVFLSFLNRKKWDFR